MEKLNPAKPGTLVSRTWVPNPNGVTKSRAECLRVMSFNLLSQHLNDQFSFQFVVLPEQGGDFLRWELRERLLIEEIQRWDPDILCLQELDLVHEQGFVEKLGSGYEVGTRGILQFK